MANDFLSAFGVRTPSPRNNPQLQAPDWTKSAFAPAPSLRGFGSFSSAGDRSFNTSPISNFFVQPGFRYSALQQRDKGFSDMGRIFMPQNQPGYQPPATINAGNTNYGGDASQSRGLEGTKQWQSQMQQAGTEAGVPWQVLASIMGIESGGDNKNDPGGAMGLMQIMPGIWQTLANQYGGNLNDPYTNIRTAADILKMNYDKYGSWDKAAAAYFGAIDGDGNITGAKDSYGTDGYTYVSLFRNNLSALGYGTPSPAETESGGQGASPWASAAVQTAMTMQGVPYILGGDTPGGFDCSGLVEWAYGQQGKYFGRTAQQQYENTQHISSDQLQPGDLVFFTETDPNNPNPVSHVGIYLGNGQMLQAPKEGDVVKISWINDPYWQQHLYGFGRVV